MVMLTYQMPESIRQIAMGGEFNAVALMSFLKLKVKVMMPGSSTKSMYKNGLTLCGVPTCRQV
jgi:hypothetical protein